MIRRSVLASLLAVCVAPPLAAQQPLSAIDWLSDSVDVVRPATAPRPARPFEPPVSGGTTIETITVVPLDRPAPDGIGLISAKAAGLPDGLWGMSDAETIALALTGLAPRALPAVQEATRRILLARLDPPRGGGAQGVVLRSRVDALLARGALQEAGDLLGRADLNRPEIFRRAFDVALLTGREDAACAKLRATPGIAPSVAVRIFCLARGGDWSAAALTLNSARVLKEVSRDEDILLARFLDPELAEDTAMLVLPAQPTPLTYRMLEAIGEGFATRSLPLAFSHADLRSTAGWKSRLEAAERLAKTGGIPAETLFEIYGERRAAASGGVWDRVAAVQRLTAALTEGDRRAARRALRESWREMGRADLLVPLAEIHGAAAADLIQGGNQSDLALRLGLLSPDAEALAQIAGATATDAETRLLADIARGLPPDTDAQAAQGLSGAVARAFAQDAKSTDPDFLELLAENRRGEALLAALTDLAPGLEADPGAITPALTKLRHLGQETTARQVALQLLILETLP